MNKELLEAMEVLDPNFINVRTAYASEIWVQLTKNLLAKSDTEKHRENIRRT